MLATYTSGEVRDVTREAFLESANTEVAAAGKSGLMTALRRGEAPVLARFEGNYASTTLTVMGDRTGFAWSEPPAYSKIDQLVAAKWQRMKILPSGLCTDAEFVRRVHLDLTGLPPTAERGPQVPGRRARQPRQARRAGRPPDRQYRLRRVLDQQVGRPAPGQPQVPGGRGLGGLPQLDPRPGRRAILPYDKFVRTILTASGSNRENPAAAYFKILREPTATMENTTQLFLAVRFNCNKCHDHPFERWTQDQYYQTAAYFAQVDLKADPESKGRMIGGTEVEAAKPLFELVSDTSKAEVVHDRTKKVTAPKFPYQNAYHKPAAGASRRVELAEWLTSKDNPYFARSYVNRLWGYMLGAGIIEPLDDIRAGNPPSNPELLDYLTEEFVKSGFDVAAHDAADLQVADVPVVGRDQQVERRRQGELLARAGPPAAGRGAARRRLPRDRLGLEDPGRAGGHPRRGAAGLGRGAAQRLPDDLRPPGPRERLRVRALQRHAARAGHGPGQRPDPGRRPGRPGERADPAGRPPRATTPG